MHRVAVNKKNLTDFFQAMEVLNSAIITQLASPSLSLLFTCQGGKLKLPHHQK